MKKMKKNNNNKKKMKWKKYSALFILSFFIGHVYGRAELLHWVHVLERVRMRASFWDSSWCIFWVRVWVAHSIFVIETSDLSFVSLDHCSIHHSIHFLCEFSPCFDVDRPVLTFLSFFFLLISLCYFFRLYYILSLHFFPHLAWCLIWGTYIGPWLMRFPMHCISHMRGMCIISLGSLGLFSLHFFTLSP